MNLKGSNSSVSRRANSKYRTDRESCRTCDEEECKRSERIWMEVNIPLGASVLSGTHGRTASKKDNARACSVRK